MENGRNIFPLQRRTIINFVKKELSKNPVQKYVYNNRKEEKKIKQKNIHILISTMYTEYKNTIEFKDNNLKLTKISPIPHNI